MTTGIPLSAQKKIFLPMPGNNTAFNFREIGMIARAEIDFSIGPFDHGVWPMLALTPQLLDQLHFVKLIVTIGVAQSIDAGASSRFTHDEIKTVIGIKQAMRSRALS